MMIQRIIRRDCHVSLSNRAVIKHVISRLKHKRQTWRTLSRAERKAFMRDCIKVHAENRSYYAWVMGGRY
jgi:acyl-CoA reductase-like NAD-dependent aldehyde dehydrogenase